jgi:hypothetical protein
MQKKKSIFNLLYVFLNFYVAKFTAFKNLVQTETKLAIKHFITLFILVIIFALLLFSTWVSLLFLLFTYFISLSLSPIVSASFIVLINFVSLLAIFISCMLIKRNAFFPRTRGKLQRLTHKEK